MLRVYNTTPGTATNDTAPRQSQVLYEGYTASEHRSHITIQHRQRSLAQQRATFSPAKTIATTRAPNRPSTRTPCTRPSSRSRNLRSFHAGWAATISHRGGVQHHQSSTRDKGATPSPCRPNLTSGRSWIWGRHRSHGLPAQYMVRCGGRVGTCDCWKEH